MPRVNAQARIRGFPRERKSGPSKLEKELLRKRLVLRINATMGIVGLPDSGRKTLGYRLANMNRGAFREVPAAYFYVFSFGRRFKEFYCRPYARFLVTVTIYIIPEPEIPPSRTRSGATQYRGPAGYIENWNDFCCMAFAFDVGKPETFIFPSLSLNVFRRFNLRIPDCFLVGNKCDARDEPPAIRPASDERPVPVRTAYMEATHLGATTYFELSAKYNRYVEPLYHCILEKALRDLN